MYYRRLCCASSAGEIHQSHNPDGNLLLSVGARSQLVSLVAQDWAVCAALVMYATIFRPGAHLALWILFKALPVFSPAEWKKKAESDLPNFLHYPSWICIPYDRISKDDITRAAGKVELDSWLMTTELKVELLLSESSRLFRTRAKPTFEQFKEINKPKKVMKIHWCTQASTFPFTEPAKHREEREEEFTQSHRKLI
ncbi:hypothetical protein B0H13DRAFT_1866463 [Mycena leptocephala]|nr:hypothetical protein B0H13DRAFT_1866463 [Mycena leptocephala]